MKKFSLLLVSKCAALACCFLYLVSFSPVQAASTPKISITPDYLSFKTEVSDSVALQKNLSVTLRSDTDVTLYPVAFDWNPYEHFLVPGHWFDYSSTPISLIADQDLVYNFSILTPARAVGGEYYKAIAFSDQPFTTVPSTDPSNLVGIPIVVDVNSSFSAPSTNSSSSQPPSQSTSNTGISIPTIVNKITTFFSKPKLPAPPPSRVVNSQITLKSKLLRYNPTSFSETMDLEVSNQGNISGNPVGFVYILDKNNNLLDKISFADGSNSILPNSSHTYSINYKPNSFEIGNLKAQIWLGDKSQEGQINPRVVSEESFFYLPKEVALASFLFLIITLLSIRSPIPQVRFALPIAFLIISASIFYLFYSKPKPANTLGTIDVTGAVVLHNGIQVTVLGNQRSVSILNNSPKGWIIYAINQFQGQIVAQQSGSLDQPTTVTVPDSMNTLPILVLTKPFI